jgi:hypothetical protein
VLVAVLGGCAYSSTTAMPAGLTETGMICFAPSDRRIEVEVTRTPLSRLTVELMSHSTRGTGGVVATAWKDGESSGWIRGIGVVGQSQGFSLYFASGAGALSHTAPIDYRVRLVSSTGQDDPAVRRTCPAG